MLLTGESGTGKEVMAKTIHQLSKRVKGPERVANCANFTDTLLEASAAVMNQEFAGATKKKDGLFLQANSGTLFAG